jgi:hypothetical protein
MPLSASDPSGNTAVLEWLAKTEVQLALGVGCALTELAFDGKLNDPITVAATTFTIFVGIGAGNIIGSGIVYSLTAKAFSLRVLGASLGVGLGAAGMGFAMYGVYDAYLNWENGNKSFGGFVSRLACTAVDFGVMIAAARATAKSLSNAFKPFPKGHFNLPKPTMTSDYTGFRFEWPGGQPAPVVRLELDGSTVVVVDVFRRSNPKGSAGQMIAEAIQMLGMRPKSIRFSPIDNAETLSALRPGFESGTVLGKTLQNTIESLGATIRGWSSSVSANPSVTASTFRGQPWLEATLSFP